MFKNVFSPNGRKSAWTPIISVKKEMPVEGEGRSGKGQPETTLLSDAVSIMVLTPYFHFLSEPMRASLLIPRQQNCWYLASCCCREDGFPQHFHLAWTKRMMDGEFQMLGVPWCSHFSLLLPHPWQPSARTASWDGTLLCLFPCFLSGWGVWHIFKSNRILFSLQMLHKYQTQSRISCVEQW